MGSVPQLEYSPYVVSFNPSPLGTRRKLRVVCIGAGYGGLTLAYKLVHESKLVDESIDFTLYERQVRIVEPFLSSARSSFANNPNNIFVAYYTIFSAGVS